MHDRGPEEEVHKPIGFPESKKTVRQLGPD